MKAADKDLYTLGLGHNFAVDAKMVYMPDFVTELGFRPPLSNLPGIRSGYDGLCSIISANAQPYARAVQQSGHRGATGSVADQPVPGFLLQQTLDVATAACRQLTSDPTAIRAASEARDSQLRLENAEGRVVLCGACQERA